MRKKYLLALLAPLSLSACVTASPDNMPMVTEIADQPVGNVLFFRGHSLQAKLADAYIGAEEGYFAQLDEDQYTRIELDSGFHLFKAKARGSVASESHIKVSPGETVCIEARPNYEELEWLAVPFLNALIPSFVLEESPCPEETKLAEFTQV